MLKKIITLSCCVMSFVLFAPDIHIKNETDKEIGVRLQGDWDPFGNDFAYNDRNRALELVKAGENKKMWVESLNETEFWVNGKSIKRENKTPQENIQYIVKADGKIEAIPLSRK